MDFISWTEVGKVVVLMWMAAFAYNFANYSGPGKDK